MSALLLTSCGKKQENQSFLNETKVREDYYAIEERDTCAGVEFLNINSTNYTSNPISTYSDTKADFNINNSRESHSADGWILSKDGRFDGEQIRWPGEILPWTIITDIQYLDHGNGYIQEIITTEDIFIDIPK
jgi:hypothetical protein